MAQKAAASLRDRAATRMMFQPFHLTLSCILVSVPKKTPPVEPNSIAVTVLSPSAGTGRSSPHRLA